MDTLESLDAILKDFEETREKMKVSFLPRVQMYNKIHRAIEEQYLNGTRKREDLDSKVNILNEKLQQMFNEGNLLTCEKDSLMNAAKDMSERKQEKEEEFRIQEKKISSRRKAVLLYEERLSMKMKSIGVTRCAPELSDVDVMLSELNATNDLHKFIVSMRRKFQQSVCYS